MQQNPNPQADDAARQRTKSKRPRPYTIQVRVRRWLTEPKERPWGDWYNYGAYRTTDERDATLADCQRKHATDDWIEFRAGPDLV